MSIQRVVFLGGLVAAAGLTAIATSPAPVTDNGAQCRSAFGSLNDGTCLDGPSAPARQFPPVGVGSTDNGGPGLTTGPLLPGQTIDVPMPIAGG
jgi:hypothetical protein